MKTLIVNADDFGFTRDVNEGIVHCHRHGILTATTLMANGAAFDHAVSLARENPDLDVGVHCVLVGGEGQPETISALIAALAAGRIRPLDVIRVQIEKILEAGIRLTHLDTHKHTHLLPPVLEAVARLSEEYRIRWVRRPFDLPINGQPAPLSRRIVSQGLGFVRQNFHRTLARHGRRMTDHFAGFSLTGYLDSAGLINLFNQLPEGITELMVHPGFHTAELDTARTRLKASRQRELEALVDPAIREALEKNEIVLSQYSRLTPGIG